MNIKSKLAAILCILLAPALLTYADTGHEGAIRTERGSYGDTRKVTGSSVTGTAFFSGTVKRADGTCFNNSQTTIWVSTNNTTQNNVVHSNITFGFPVLSSSTFILDGCFSGELDMTCDIGIASCEFRCIDGKVQ